MSFSGDDELVFMMGEDRVRIPRDRMYSRNHCWVQEGPGGFRVGLTEFAVHLLQEIYFLDWKIEPQTLVKMAQEIGEIESSKTVSSLTPAGNGRLLDFNSLLLDDPSVINTDGYGLGWLYHIETDARFMFPEEYVKFLGAEWDEIQRKANGPANEN
ncbi:MAG TPA: glycine cleavage system protein H [Planctomicrobium sp.]|nr:glycine cleavage system protein H [Planctomicrobium sp.]